MYFIYDIYCNRSIKKSKQELISLLFDEVKEHMLNNLNIKDLVKLDLETITEMFNSNNETDLTFLKTKLNEYGWFVVDIDEIKYKLNDIKIYGGEDIYKDTIKYVMEDIN